MASGLRYWGAALLLGMAIIAVWALPLSPDPPRIDDRINPQTERFQALQSQVVLEIEYLRRLDLLDSLTAVLHAAGPAPSVAAGPAWDRELTGLVETRLRSVVSVIESPKADVGVFLMPLPAADPPLSPAWAITHAEHYVGVAAGRPYCVDAQFDINAREVVNRPLRQPTEVPVETMGSCYFVLRYGIPGPSVSRWLKDGSFSRGMRRHLRGNDFEYLREAGDLADRSGVLTDLTIVGKNCVRGDLVACAEVFHRPARLDSSTGSLLSERIPELWSVRTNLSVYGGHLGFIEPVLLADLERQFGEERFTRFWTSEQDVALAFERAFGVSPAEWVHGWARGYYAQSATSLAGLGGWAATLLALFGALVWVSATVSRRRVG